MWFLLYNFPVDVSGIRPELFVSIYQVGNGFAGMQHGGVVFVSTLQANGGKR